MIKVLYDIEQLLSAKGKETGICRVSLEVLKELNQRPGYEVYPLVTIKDKGAAEYLKNKGLENLVDRTVYLPYLKKTTKCYNWRQKIKSALLMRCFGERYKQEIDKYDEYVSIFSPISDIVYDSHVHTKIFVHDLIPIKFPEFTSAKFAEKYKKWMANLRADEVFCISHSTRMDFFAERPDYDERKVKVVYLAADAKFKPTSSPDIREKYGIKTKKYFLAVSELTERKNFEHLVKAFLRFLDNSKTEDTLPQFIKYIKETLNFEIIYPLDELKEADKSDYVYFKTDHHWTDWGAYIGYQALLKQLKKDFPDIYEAKEGDFDISYSKKVRAEADRKYWQGYTCNLLYQNQDCSLNIDYKYYDGKNKHINAISYGEFHNSDGKYKALLIGNSFTENFKPFLVYSFKDIKRFRCNIAPNDNLKLSRWKKEILEFKPDVLILLFQEGYTDKLRTIKD